jgi:ribosomal protein S18 acetylase RimI-like enzyme
VTDEPQGKKTPMAAAYHVRLAGPRDTPVIAELMLSAGAGLYEHLLQDVVAGLSPADLLSLAIADEEGPYYFGNALVAEIDGTAQGLILGFSADRVNLPEAAFEFVPPERLHPVQKLFEAKMKNAFYVNSLAVNSGFPGRGLGRSLLDTAGRMAAMDGFDTLCLHVWAENAPAVGLYTSLGFDVRETIDILHSPYFKYHPPMNLMAVRIDTMLARLEERDRSAPQVL